MSFIFAVVFSHSKYDNEWTTNPIQHPKVGGTPLFLAQTLMQIITKINGQKLLLVEGMIPSSSSWDSRFKWVYFLLQFIVTVSWMSYLQYKCWLNSQRGPTCWGGDLHSTKVLMPWGLTAALFSAVIKFWGKQCSEILSAKTQHESKLLFIRQKKCSFGLPGVPQMSPLQRSLACFGWTPSPPSLTSGEFLLSTQSRHEAT